MRSPLGRLARWAGLSQKRCPVCGRLMESGSLCPDCAHALRPRTGGYCPQCASLFGDGDEPPALCPECVHEPPPWETVHFHNAYADTLRTLILSYKFKRGLGRTRLLADLAVNAFKRGGTPPPDVIIPVPLHTRRLLSRGFNQSLEIANELGRTLDRPVLKTALTRIRHTPPQTRLGRTARRENIRNAFTVDHTQVAHRTILLVDDVYTTGATLRECARTWRRPGYPM